MKKIIKRIIIAVVVLLLLGLIVYRFMDHEEVEQVDTRTAVSVETPVLRDIINTTDVIGTIEPAEEVDVTPKMSGDVLTVDFEVGQHVSEGDTLITIDSDALDSLKIQLDSAEISKNDAQTALSRVQALFATGAVSQSDLESAQSAAKGASLQYDAALNQYDLQMEYTTVTAPISGIIESKNIEVHDSASPAASICSISGHDGMSVSFGITEKAKDTLNVGDAIEIEKNNNVYAGKITEIGSKVGTSGLFEVKASLDATDAFNSGEQDKVSIVSQKADQVMSVPINAISYASGSAYLYTFADGKAVKTDVTVGLYDDEYIEVDSGLDMSSQVITTWGKEIYDGAEVFTEQ